MLILSVNNFQPTVEVCKRKSGQDQHAEQCTAWPLRLEMCEFHHKFFSVAQQFGGKLLSFSKM